MEVEEQIKPRRSSTAAKASQALAMAAKTEAAETAEVVADFSAAGPSDVAPSWSTEDEAMEAFQASTKDAWRPYFLCLAARENEWRRLRDALFAAFGGGWSKYASAAELAKTYGRWLDTPPSVVERLVPLYRFMVKGGVPKPDAARFAMGVASRVSVREAMRWRENLSDWAERFKALCPAKMPMLPAPAAERVAPTSEEAEAVADEQSKAAGFSQALLDALAVAVKAIGEDAVLAALRALA